jgi:hypothetical protein
MKTSSVVLSCLLASALLIATGCAPSPETPTVQTEIIPLANETEEGTEEGPLNTPEISPEDSPVEGEATKAVEVENLSPDPTSAIVHQTQPGNPVFTQSISSECNTGYNFSSASYRIQPPCDSWDINLLERAVSADFSQFYQYLDILSARTGLSNGWIYFGIELFGAGVPADGVDLTYFVEIDRDQNGRGDVLISATNLDLYGSDWTTTGVKAFLDLTGDVGGITAVRADSLPGADGYETMVFDDGKGDDPDLVWVRRNPGRFNQVEFAIKTDLLNRDVNFMWWVGALRGGFDPQVFDLVDSQDSASFFEIDTTCGLVYGREEAYNIKKCYVAPIPTPTVHVQSQQATAEATEEVCVQPPHPDPQNNCWIWFPEECEWICFN